MFYILLFTLIMLLFCMTNNSNVITDIKVYASFTSVPHRLDKSEKIVKSLLRQSYPIEKIYINIPVGKHKRTGKEYYIPDYLNKYSDKVIVNRCPEYGPATKLLGSVEHIHDPNAFIYVVDDDMAHSRNHLKKLISNIKNIDDVDCVTNRLCASNRNYKEGICGNHGFIVKRKILDNIYDFYDKLSKDCATVDDIWLGVYFHTVSDKIKNAPIIDSIYMFIKNCFKDWKYNDGLSGSVNKHIDNDKLCYSKLTTALAQPDGHI